MTQQGIHSNWNQLKGKVREHWNEIPEDELNAFEGNLDQLVGMIEQQTPETREAVEHQIAAFAREAARGAEQTKRDRAAVANRDGEQVASDSQRDASPAAAICQTYQAAQQVIKRRPAESLAVSFAAGLVSGVGVALMLRSE